MIKTYKCFAAVAVTSALALTSGSALAQTCSQARTNGAVIGGLVHVVDRVRDGYGY